MLIASFEDWKALKINDLSAENPLVDCPDCDGSGEVDDFCACCDRGDVVACGLCDESGKVRFLDVKDQYVSQLAYGTYFKEVIGDLKKWAAYTREDFLELAGPFVDEFRRAH
ncbi:hypothetical protein [Cycloclasticus pugetii]|uniref:hypothetical protein n=1 Tax=Cycloclasticus pugetii TaxID=34068 RepID=UPI003A93C93E